ncbi:mucin-19-like [Haliotis asinina]|uniref:mucin-19-like n=1 Tax=Haliotis asinina TaxID=109174 RepID=UPI003531BE3A
MSLLSFKQTGKGGRETVYRMHELTAMTYWPVILCTLAFCCGVHAQPFSATRIRSLLPQSVAFKLLLLKPPASSGSLLPQREAPTISQRGPFNGNRLIRSDPRLGSSLVQPLLDPTYGSNQFSDVGGYSETISPTGFPEGLSGSGIFAGTSGGSLGFSGGNPLDLSGIDSTGLPGNFMGSGGLLGDMTGAGNAGLTLEQLSGGFGQDPVGDLIGTSGQSGGLPGLHLTPGSLTSVFPGGADTLVGQSENSQGFGMYVGQPSDFLGTEQQNVNNGMGMNIFPERIPTSPPQTQVIPTKPPTTTGQSQGLTSGSVMALVDKKQRQNTVGTQSQKMQPTLSKSRQKPTKEGAMGQLPGSAVIGIANGQIQMPHRPALVGVGPPIIERGTILPPSAVLPDGGVVVGVDGSDATVQSPGGIETTVDGTDINQEVVV